MNSNQKKKFLSRYFHSWGVKWRSSYWFVTFVVWLGIFTDLIVYSIIVPVIPFELELLGYSNVSALTGWLMFSYSLGLASSTIFVSMISEACKTRQAPLPFGNVILVGAQIMFMEAPTYWVMCFARAMQGIGSTMIWVVGLALICDVTPESKVGLQLGLALSGLTIGTLLGPPLGGALYAHLGFRSPFILGIIFAFIDLMGRILIIEKRRSAQGSSNSQPVDEVNGPCSTQTSPILPPEPLASPKNVKFTRVLLLLLKSPRAIVAGAIGIGYGILTGLQDTILTMHLNDVWGLTSERVGVVMLAPVIPTIFAPPITGWLSDRAGAAWIMLVGILLVIPWCGVMIVEGSLGLFIASYALQSFFMASVVSPLLSELSAVSRNVEGIGYAHVHGVFNFTFGVGATIGPIIGGQFYDNLSHGFMFSYVFLIAVFGFCAVMTFFYAGDVSVASQLYHYRANKLERREREV